MVRLDEPHNVLWFIILGLIVGAVYFGLFKEIIEKLMVISGLFVAFYFLDPIIFDARGNSVVTLFSRNLFTSRWQAFPVFLLEIFVFWLLSDKVLEPFVTNVVQNDYNGQTVVIWIVLLFAFYWFKASRAD